jgi:hypothetical protein
MVANMRDTKVGGITLVDAGQLLSIANDGTTPVPSRVLITALHYYATSLCGATRVTLARCMLAARVAV